MMRAADYSGQLQQAADNAMPRDAALCPAAQPTCIPPDSAQPSVGTCCGLGARTERRIRASKKTNASASCPRHQPATHERLCRVHHSTHTQVQVLEHGRLAAEALDLGPKIRFGLGQLIYVVHACNVASGVSSRGTAIHPWPYTLWYRMADLLSFWLEPFALNDGNNAWRSENPTCNVAQCPQLKRTAPTHGQQQGQQAGPRPPEQTYPDVVAPLLLRGNVSASSPRRRRLA
jgi:hypothetical protein